MAHQSFLAASPGRCSCSLLDLLAEHRYNLAAGPWCLLCDLQVTIWDPRLADRWCRFQLEKAAKLGPPQSPKVCTTDLHICGSIQSVMCCFTSAASISFHLLAHGSYPGCGDSLGRAIGCLNFKMMMRGSVPRFSGFERLQRIHIVFSLLHNWSANCVPQLMVWGRVHASIDKRNVRRVMMLVHRQGTMIPSHSIDERIIWLSSQSLVNLPPLLPAQSSLASSRLYQWYIRSLGHTLLADCHKSL